MGHVCKAFILAALISVLSSSAFAATLVVHDADPFDDTLCHYTFSGEIMPGDSRYFETLGGTTYGMTLCLDSPGGALGEALKIFERVWDVNLRTEVRPGAECLSSCALIFLGGSLLEGTDVTRQMDRTLWVGGQLGYHGPGLAQSTEALVDPSKVRQAFGTALLAATRLFELNRISDRGRSPMTDHLLHQWLRTPFDDMYMIETVGDAILADIPVAGLRYPETITDQHLQNVCNNVYLRGGFPEAGGRSSTIVQDFTNTRALLDRLAEEYHYQDRTLLRRDDPDHAVGFFGPFYSATKYYVLGCRVSVNPQGVRAFGPRDYYFGDYPISVMITEYEQDEEIPAILASGESNRERVREQLPPIYLYPMDQRLDQLALTPLPAAVQEPVALKPPVPAVPSAPNYTHYIARDLLGGDLTSMRLASGLDVQPALDACAQRSDCVAVTVDRWNGLAFLKSIATFVRPAEIQPKADSFIKAEHLGLYRLSSRKPVIRRRKDKAFDGESYRRIDSLDYEDCAAICLGDSECHGFNFRAADRFCSLFNRPPEYFTRAGVQIGLKLQVE